MKALAVCMYAGQVWTKEIEIAMKTSNTYQVHHTMLDKAVTATKKSQSTTSILKLMFFRINLHFVKSNQKSTYRKLNLHLTSSTYFVFLPLEMQKRLEQTKVYYSFSYFVWKETTHKSLKVAAAKTLLSRVCFIGATCFDESYLFYMITERHYFSWKFIVTLRLLKRHVVAFFSLLVFWKKSVFYVLSPQ